MLRALRLFRPRVETLEDRCVPAIDFSQVKAQLPGLLQNMQSALTQEVLADRMPLVGSGLQSPANNPAMVLSTLASTLGPVLPTSNTAPASQVQDAIYNALNGLHLFPPGSTEAQDVEVVPITHDDYEFKVHIASQSPINLSRPFDLGLPALGLTASGTVNVALTYQLELDFEVAVVNNATHLYLDTAPSPELSLHVDVTLPGSSATGNFGPLGINVYDGVFPANKPWMTSPSMAPSEFKGTFSLDVTGPKVDASQASAAYFLNHTSVGLDGDANANLAVELTVTDFPALALNLQVAWPFHNGTLAGGVPTVSFNDVQLDVGSLLTKVLMPFASTLNKTLTPVNEIVGSFTQPLPVISDLAGHDVSLFDVAKAIDPGLSGLQSFVTAFQALYGLNSTLLHLPPQDAVIDYGSFDLGGADPRAPGFDPTTITPNITTPNQPSARTQLQNNPNAQDIFNFIYDPKTGLEGSDLGQLHLPFLDVSLTVFRTMLGQQVGLLDYSTPAMDSGSGGNSELRINEDFGGVLGPLGVRVDGAMTARAGLSVGYDTYGLLHNNPLDGLFVSKADASLLGTFSAALDFNIGGFFDPYIQGGVTSTINLSLASSPIRFGQLMAAQDNPLNLFMSPAGKIDGFLDAGVRIGIDLPFIGFVGADFGFQVADKVLLDLDSLAQAQITLATLNNGVLTLNLGQQLNGQPEVFEVGHHLGNSTQGDETVDVTAYGVTQTFEGVSQVVANPSGKDETILFDPNLLDGAQVSLGDTNNIVTYLGHGDVTFTAGKGNNTFTGGAGKNVCTITGNGHNILIGGPGPNTLTVAGDGTNKLVAGKGNDQLSVNGAGANTLIAGAGDDTFNVMGPALGSAGNTLSWAVGDGTLVIQAQGGSNAIEVAGTTQRDIFTVNPFPASSPDHPGGQGVEVIANGVKITANAFVQKVAIEGVGGGDTTTVNDLGTRCMVEEVGVNLGQALTPSPGQDVTTVNGNPDTHQVTVATEAAWLSPPAPEGGSQEDGGVMMVQTRPGYKVDVAIVNQKDDLIVNAKGSQNAIGVLSNTGHTVINTDAGSDAFTVGSSAAPSKGQLYYVPPPPASPSLLFGLRGVLDLHAGPGSNALALIDSQDAGVSHLTVTASSITGFTGNPNQPVTIHYSTSPAGTFAGGIAVQTGKGKDVVALQGSPAGSPVALATGGGGDQVRIGDAAGTLASLGGPVSIDGGDGTPTVTLDDHGAAGGRNYLFTSAIGSYFVVASNKVAPANIQGFKYLNIGTLVLEAGNHGNTITARVAGAAVIVHAGNGSNSVVIGDQAGGNHLVLTQPFTVDGQLGDNALTVNDQGTSLAMLAYTLGAGTVQRSLAGLISYSGVQHLTLNTGNGVGDVVAVQGSTAGPPITVVGAGPIALSGPAGSNVWDVTGPDAGTLQGSLQSAPITFSGMKSLFGGSGKDTFRFHNGGSISGTVSGGGGSNTLDYSAYTGDVSVNLKTHKATHVAGQVKGFENVLGSKGNDVLVGGGQPVTLRGGTGRSILIAEAGKSRLFGGDGDSILVAGLTLYDANQAALDKIMMEWKRNLPVADRVHHITLGGGLNGAFRLFRHINGTVGSNGQVNDLTDGGGTTWLFLKKGVDKHHNAQSNDIVTAL